MQTGKNKELVKKFVVFINTLDEKIANEIISPEIEFNTPIRKEPYRGPGGYIELLKHIRHSFSDVQWELNEMIAEGNKVACLFTASGTHDGEFQGIAPTHKKVSWPAMNIYTFKDNKLIHEYALPDFLTVLRQIG